MNQLTKTIKEILTNTYGLSLTLGSDYNYYLTMVNSVTFIPEVSCVGKDTDLALYYFDLKLESLTHLN